MGAMPAPNQKITVGEMRSSGVRSLLICCADYHCSHLVAISAEQRADDVRLSDIEPQFVCSVWPDRSDLCRWNIRRSWRLYL